MENKRETKKELDLDQLEQLTGGTGYSTRSSLMTCVHCGEEFDLTKPGKLAAFREHIKNCTQSPSKS